MASLATSIEKLLSLAGGLSAKMLALSLPMKGMVVIYEGMDRLRQ